MSNVTPPGAIIRFADFEVDLCAGNLRKRGLRIKLPGQSFQVLAVLLEHAGEAVTREELRRRLWPEHVFVDFAGSLNAAVARLREALNDSAEHPRFIETLPRRGYRFFASLSEAPARRPRLLVLPFANLTGDPTQDYFSDAMTEEIISALAAVAHGRLAVIARTTAMHYKGTQKAIARIGRDLAVDYIVEGSLRRAGSHISVNVQLVRPNDEANLWTNRYDAEESDIFSVEAAAAQDIATHLGVPPLCAPRKPTEDLVAYNLYIQGRPYSIKGTPEGFAKAKHYFEQAVARDPSFALAYDSLAELHYYLGFTGLVPPKETLSTGLFYALHAIEIDNTLAETHALLGHFRKQLDYDWAEVCREMSCALELNPASPLVRLRYAMNGLMPQGRIDEAIAEIEQALESDPLSTHARIWLGTMCWLGRHYDRGLEEMLRLLEVEPAYYMAYFVMGQNYSGKGMFEEAIAAHQKATDLSGGVPLMLGWPGIPLGKLGRTTEARSMLERLRAIAKQTYVPPTAFAWVHLGLGETDSFFDAMDRAVDARDHMLTGIKSYWFLDELRDDPRYLALLRRMNLTP